MFIDVENYLGDEAVFLGSDQSISFLASKFSGCKANSIYYMDQNGLKLESSVYGPKILSYDQTMLT